MPVSTKELFMKDITLSKNILDACDAIFSMNESTLTNFKARFNSGFKDCDGKSSGTGGDGAKVATLGSSPPSASTQDLKRMATIQAMPATIFTRVIVRDDYKPLRGEIMNVLGPIKDLIAACKSRINGIKNKKDGLKDLKDKKFGDIASPQALLFPFNFGRSACRC